MTAAEFPLSREQRAAYERDGFLLLPDFYDVPGEIEPVQRGIHQIIGLVIRRHNLPIPQEPFSPAEFDSGLQPLIGANRAYGGEVYDAVKQIPAFIRLVASQRHESLVREIRGNSVPGVAAGSYGIRIDNPGEDRYRARWHQDYHSHLRSSDGLVFWSPLRRVTEDLGPVEICVGSHKGGPLPVLTYDPTDPTRTGSLGLTVVDEEDVVRPFTKVAPLSKPGDLLLFDFQLFHRSGFNTSNRSRWSMQLRYFNFMDPTGMRIGWRGSFAAGVKLADVHPELVKA